MTWDDYRDIGEALAETYPRANYLTISRPDLVHLVEGLSGFAGVPPPDELTLSAIAFAWIAAVEGPDDSGPYDSLG
jgi:FeS assembly protein IscX